MAWPGTARWEPRAPSRAVAIGFIALCVVQTARSASNMRSASRQRKEHGGTVDCGRKKTSLDFGSMPILGLSERGQQLRSSEFAHFAVTFASGTVPFGEGVASRPPMT